MKKYIIAGVLVAAFVAYLIFANKNSAPVAILPSGTPNTTRPATLPVATTSLSDTPPTTGGGTGTGNRTTTATTGQYKDGTYTGTVADAFYGNLQAIVTIQGGMITNITFPQSPSGGHSGNLSAQALPLLKQEAIAAQSANVNVVSGATQDSQAFQQSLASALAQAKS
jgi:uncharacterized protein with FMN-binding domain